MNQVRRSPYDRILTIPTLLTLSRIVLIPFIMQAVRAHDWFHAWLLIGSAAVTDFLDGRLARAYGDQTFVGACLDPIADKCLLLSCFYAFATDRLLSGMVPLWFVWLLIIKELFIVIGAAFLFVLHGRLDIAPSVLGKTTTALSLIFICLITLQPLVPILSPASSASMVVVLAAFSMTCLAHYSYVGMRWAFGRTMLSFLVGVSAVLTTNSAYAKNSFVIAKSPKRVSASAIKEQLGSCYGCMVKTQARVTQHMARITHLLVDRSQELIDGACHASSEQLRSYLDELNTYENSLAQIEKDLEHITAVIAQGPQQPVAIQGPAVTQASASAVNNHTSRI